MGTCGTFMVKNLMMTLLCFSETDGKKSCRSLKRTNDDSLSRSINFVFENEFELDAIQDSTHDHWMASLASYQGFPLILGGENNVKLEMIDTRKNPSKWVEYEGTDYRYQNR